MESKKHDYLKYWRVIRQFMKVRYGLTQGDLELLLFLYSESYFDKSKFNEFDALLGWNRSRFENLRKDGWIEVFRKRQGKRKAIYKLTMKTNRMIQSMYRKLNGEEIPVSQKNNKLFAKNVSYLDKKYRDMILEMNATIKQQRHPSPE